MIFLKDAAQFISTAGRTVNFMENDIIMPLVGSELGKVYHYSENLPPKVKNHAVIIRTDLPKDAMFSALEAKYEEIKRMAKGTAMKRIYIKDIESLQIDMTLG